MRHVEGVRRRIRGRCRRDVVRRPGLRDGARVGGRESDGRRPDVIRRPRLRDSRDVRAPHERIFVEVVRWIDRAPRRSVRHPRGRLRGAVDRCRGRWRWCRGRRCRRRRGGRRRHRGGRRRRFGHRLSVGFSAEKRRDDDHGLRQRASKRRHGCAPYGPTVVVMVVAPTRFRHAAYSSSHVCLSSRRF